jgi:hypothetical protein
MDLSQQQLHAVLDRFPIFELSYETLTHKKVPSNYDICLAVPSGRKYFLWCTFYKNSNVCYLMELNKEKRVVRATVINTRLPNDCCIGTILYGSLVRPETSKPFFVIEDVYLYKGIPYKQVCFKDKLCVFREMFIGIYRHDNPAQTQEYTPIYLPFIWRYTEPVPSFPYSVHHIQYRDCYRICPYLNVLYGLREPVPPPTLKIPELHVSKYTLEYNKPQYKYPSIFRVMADIQYDIYHLYACGPPPNDSSASNRSFVYYDMAYIPNYKKSVFMNGLFRNIRENQNLDFIEESDNEEDFENTRDDKYVDLKKELFMECSFHTKFKRWVPIRVVDKREKVVHIYKLARL